MAKPRGPNERWEQGVPHHPKSEEIFKSIAKTDLELNEDYFCWKSGGDGDNGEFLMYLLDEYFEQLEATQSRTPTKLAQIGYAAYWKVYDGESVPKWDELPAHMRRKWEAAITAVVSCLKDAGPQP